VSFRSPAECCRFVPASSLQYDKAPSRGFRPSSRHQPAASHLARESHLANRAVLGVSHALDGFLRHWPCGFISPHSHVQGSLSRGFPPDEAVPSRRRPVPSSLAPARCPTVARRAPRTCAPPSGLALHRDPLQRRRCLGDVTTRSPPELSLLQVFPLLVVGAPSRPLRSWPSPQIRRCRTRGGLQRFPDEKPGWLSPESFRPARGFLPAGTTH
jgi:hypothetical protein